MGFRILSPSLRMISARGRGLRPKAPRMAIKKNNSVVLFRQTAHIWAAAFPGFLNLASSVPVTGECITRMVIELRALLHVVCITTHGVCKRGSWRFDPRTCQLSKTR